MIGINQVTLVGNLGKNPTLGFTADGKRFAKFTVAVTNRKEITSWIPVMVFSDGLVTEVVEKFLRKGSLVTILGEIRVHKYDKGDGPRYMTQVVVAEEGRLIVGDVRKVTEKRSEPELHDFEIPF